MSYKHSRHYDRITKILPWQTRHWLSKVRGKERPLTRRANFLTRTMGFSDDFAQYILEEYMITAKAGQVKNADDWLCQHCDNYNDKTDLFCDDCGEYK